MSSRRTVRERPNSGLAGLSVQDGSHGNIFTAINILPDLLRRLATEGHSEEGMLGDKAANGDKQCSKKISWISQQIFYWKTAEVSILSKALSEVTGQLSGL